MWHKRPNHKCPYFVVHMHFISLAKKKKYIYKYIYIIVDENTDTNPLRTMQNIIQSLKYVAHFKHHRIAFLFITLNSDRILISSFYP